MHLGGDHRFSLTSCPATGEETSRTPQRRVHGEKRGTQGDALGKTDTTPKAGLFLGINAIFFFGRIGSHAQKA
jgi:hypothetical protein